MRRMIVALTLLISACRSAPKSATDKLMGSDEGPKLMKPSVRKVWVPAAIEDGGRTYREGHFIYILDKESTWSR